MQVYVVLLILLILSVVFVSMKSEKLMSLKDSPELDPKWELCAPCFAQCADSQWKGKIRPRLGETNKDMCAKLCSAYCQGFSFKWPNSVHVDFEKHGM